MRAKDYFGISQPTISKIMKSKLSIINALETGNKKQHKGPFSDSEIIQLRELVNQHGEDWCLISGIMHRKEKSL